jgi:Rrf2 family iron-sulfur cluster assembly transcriptional regulator
MIVPQTSEYALRIMSYLALLPDTGFINATQIAKETNVPKPYTSKIVRKLVVAKLLEAQKGPGGGVSIGLPLEQIKFSNILQAVDYESDPKYCAFGWGQCKADKPCPLHPTWSKLKKDFHRWADRATLMDVKKHGGNLKFRRVY